MKKTPSLGVLDVEGFTDVPQDHADGMGRRWAVPAFLVFEVAGEPVHDLGECVPKPPVFFLQGVIRPLHGF